MFIIDDLAPVAYTIREAIADRNVLVDQLLTGFDAPELNTFYVDRTSISRHLENIFETGELDEKVVCAEIAHTTQHGAMEGKTQIKSVKYYKLDAIISIGWKLFLHVIQ